MNGLLRIMIVMARDREYDDLLTDVRGRRVLLWTCNTCVRFCGGLGGKDAASALAERLVGDGVDVRGVESSSACCFMRNARRMAGSSGVCDLVLALCCDMGARNASESTGKEVLNPSVTRGPGNLDDAGEPRVASVVCGRPMVDESLSDVIARSGCHGGPF